ncbi:MAG: tyrosine-type recombinase/integrase, partial [Acidobacteria bacterium]|nr:tyrosine-type recombinase/integrase [Acidobacteriota bacterium]
MQDLTEEQQLWLFEPQLKVNMAQLKEFRDNFTRSKQARNTKIGYASDARDFTTWCAAAGRSPLPTSAETLELYITHKLQVEGLKVTTMERRVSAIRDMHRRAALTMPTTTGARAILTGARHMRHESPHGKTPLTPAELRRISAKLRALATPRDIRDRAIMVIGFTSGLRRYNLAALDTADVEIVRKGVILQIRHSKTDQNGVGAIIGLHRGKHADTCPAQTLRAWLKLRGSGQGPLFTHTTSGHNITTRRMRGAGIAEAVKRAVALIGLNPAQFSGHSLRASCATAAHLAGAPD